MIDAQKSFESARKILEDPSTLLDNIMYSMGDGLSIQDRNMRIVYQNQFMIDQFGSHIGDYCYIVYEKSNIICDGCPVIAAFRTGKVTKALRVGITKDGTPFRFENIASPLKNAQGEIVAGMELCRIVEDREKAFDDLRTTMEHLQQTKEQLSRDIAKRERIEDTLQETKNRLAAVVNTIPDLIWLKDPNGVYLACNSEFELLYDAAESEILGRTDYDFLPRDLADLIRKNDMEAIAAGRISINEEEVVYRSDGRHVILETRKVPVDIGGCVFGVLGIGRDITVQKELQCQIQERSEELERSNLELKQEIASRRLAQENALRAKEVADSINRQLESAIVRANELAVLAESASKAKSQFLANMSHELRTPMNVILGYSKLMQMDVSLTPEYREQLNIINRSGEHLLSLINDVLEISKIEAGHTALDLSFFDLHAFFHDIKNMFESSADAKGLHFEIIGIDALPQYVEADESKLRQVVLNLLGNALKFTDKGHIIVRLLVEDNTPGGLRLTGEVQDSGAGISRDEMDKVFAYFEQTASGRQKNHGTGLGLAISRNHVRMMGGDITVDSKEGEGSTFRFEIDINEGKSSDIKNKVPKKRAIGLEPGQRIPRVLVAEDMEAGRSLLVKILKKAGFEVREAADGQEAVEIFHEWHPEYIWMDIRMPVMDGLEAARLIKKSDAGGTTIVVALTAHALEEEKERILSGGFNDFVRKPFREHEIFEVMGRHLGLRYVYEDGRENDAAGEAHVTISPEQLAALPADLFSRLHGAAVELDRGRLLALLEELKTIDARMAGILKSSVKRFALGPLLGLLKKVERPENGESNGSS